MKCTKVRKMGCQISWRKIIDKYTLLFYIKFIHVSLLWLNILKIFFLYIISVTITTNSNAFDGFYLTGVYTVSTGMVSRLLGHTPAGTLLPALLQTAHNPQLCSQLHAYNTPHPSHSVHFLWTAPTEPLGCVKFL